MQVVDGLGLFDKVVIGNSGYERVHSCRLTEALTVFVFMNENIFDRWQCRRAQRFAWQAIGPTLARNSCHFLKQFFMLRAVSSTARKIFPFLFSELQACVPAAWFFESVLI